MASETEGKRVFITVDRHELGGLQLSINVEDKDGSGHGYRIAGPEYSGGSATLLKHVIDAFANWSQPRLKMRSSHDRRPHRVRKAISK